MNLSIQESSERRADNNISDSSSAALRTINGHFSMYWSKIRVAVSRILDISSDFFDFGTLGEPWPSLIVFGSFDSITVR